LVRCFFSQPVTGQQALAFAGRPKARDSKGLEPKTLVENRKRAAGIEPASSAWKAEVLPLNYARSSTPILMAELPKPLLASRWTRQRQMGVVPAAGLRLGTGTLLQVQAL